jgi:hypothetical protein
MFILYSAPAVCIRSQTCLDKDLMVRHSYLVTSAIQPIPVAAQYHARKLFYHSNTRIANPIPVQSCLKQA